ncbi:hypothetical protein [Amycolatopsis sp. RTGN1]|uniref:hypothetical protein n=1 Tax=Amycolatopsis ponsaeliensis TaxID=2992142 RepID=UPI0025507EB2|nr:hypothetical protein [Amycolatopsis sp. RTGN1]
MRAAWVRLRMQGVRNRPFVRFRDGKPGKILPATGRAIDFEQIRGRVSAPIRESPSGQPDAYPLRFFRYVEPDPQPGYPRRRRVVVAEFLTDHVRHLEPVPQDPEWAVEDAGSLVFAVVQ